jgi:hypothetical protein
MCRLSRNLGASTSWNPVGLSRAVMGLLFFIFYDQPSLHGCVRTLSLKGGIIGVQLNVDLPCTYHKGTQEELKCNSTQFKPQRLMEVSDRHAPVALPPPPPPENNHGTHWSREWVGPRVSPEESEDERISDRDSNSGPSSPSAYSLYWLHYPGRWATDP